MVGALALGVGLLLTAQLAGASRGLRRGVSRRSRNLYFFSRRVDPKSLVYQGVYSDWSIPALALK